MNKIVLIMIMSAIMMVACSDKNDGDSFSNTENPIATNQNEAPQEDILNTEEPVATDVPENDGPKESLPPQDTLVPDATPNPDANVDTSTPDSTSNPDVTSSPESQEDTSYISRYEYIAAYEMEGEKNAAEYDECKATINERIYIMGIPDAMAWVENGKIYIGYNNNSYKETIEMIAKKGVIEFYYNNDYLVFENSKIKKIAAKTDYKGEDYLIFELLGGYSEEFAQFTQEHMGGNFVLICL